MKIGARTHIGKVRQLNEDSLFVDEKSGVFVVADGMGGHNAGDVASTIAIEVVSETLMNNNFNGAIKPLDKVVESIKLANSKIYQKAKDDTACLGMGTTCTVAHIREDIMYIGHVGDSRLYILREDQLKQVTQDQTLVESLVRDGKITREEAKIHPKRNMLLNAVGTDAELEVDRHEVTLINGDTVLICSDGLNGLIEDHQIKATLQKSAEAEEICNSLIDMANDRGGYDNITAVVIKY